MSYRCSYCSFCSRDNKAFLQHLRDVHSRELGFSIDCAISGQTFVVLEPEPSSKLSGSGSVVQVGDVVILKDEHVKRASWKFAKVVKLLRGSDGIARAALLNVSTGSGPPRY